MGVYNFQKELVGCFRIPLEKTYFNLHYSKIEIMCVRSDFCVPETENVCQFLIVRCDIATSGLLVVLTNIFYLSY
jgi:hypothetical protein